MDKDLTSASTGDVSPLTTSTESETFDTWTVITGKAKDLTSDEIRFTPLTPEKSDEDEEIAVDAVRVEVLKAPEDFNENRYNDIDDLSDGISIISESESAGRLSPHTELRKHLSDLNMRFINAGESPLLAPKLVNEPTLSYEASSERSSDDFHRVEPLMENSQKTRRTSNQLVESTSFQSTCRCGLRGLFYVGALLAVLAFFSKLKYDKWESVLGTTTDELINKISDLELKNNLMRAEIDILSKQVNYLTTLSETRKYSQSKPSKPSKPLSRDDVKFRAWSGNGNTVEEVEISPKDLKKPFKCEGSNNVDIAGMCIELPISAEEMADSIGEKVRTVIDENDFFVNIEKVADQVEKLVVNPFGEPVDTATETMPPKKEDPIAPQEPTDNYTPHEHKPDKKYEKRENYKKHSTTKNNSGESKENVKPRRDRSGENSNESGERYKKSKDYKKYDKRTATEYENAKREADGQWHEKMMQHRETTRKYNEKHRHDKNWYIERGDGREQARSTEQKNRPAGQ